MCTILFPVVAIMKRGDFSHMRDKAVCSATARFSSSAAALVLLLEDHDPICCH